MHYQEGIQVQTGGQGLYEFTSEVNRIVGRSQIQTGLCTIFVRHTSASLIIQENADPSVQRDLETFLTRLVPEGDPTYTHTQEGPDDMPAHIKGALTNTSEQIPVSEGRLMLGVWQGIYLWEHRYRRGGREVIVHLSGE